MLIGFGGTYISVIVVVSLYDKPVDALWGLFGFSFEIHERVQFRGGVLSDRGTVIDESSVEVILKQSFEVFVSGHEVSRVERRREHEVARRETARVGSEHGVTHDCETCVVIDEDVVIACVAGNVDSGERADLVALAIPVIGIVIGVHGRLTGNVRFEVVPLDDSVESADVVAIAVGD
jgi:hypothetical protein